MLGPMTQRIGALMTGVAVDMRVRRRSSGADRSGRERSGEARRRSCRTNRHPTAKRTARASAKHGWSPGLWSGRAGAPRDAVLPPSFDAQKPCPVVLLLRPARRTRRWSTPRWRCSRPRHRAGLRIYAPRASGEAGWPRLAPPRFRPLAPGPRRARSVSSRASCTSSA